MIVINEDYLRRILREYFDYYQEDSRPRQSSERNSPVPRGLAKLTKITNTVEASLPADILGPCIRLPPSNSRFRQKQKAYWCLEVASNSFVTGSAFFDSLFRTYRLVLR